jgi:hypothetical protein
LPVSRVQMKLHKRKRATNNLSRSVVIVLIVEAVNTHRVIGQSERDVSRESLFHKAID